MGKKATKTEGKAGLQIIGPGLITGASDDDPSGIGTYSQAGAQFGLGLLWTMLFTFPLMSAIQEIAARIGRATGQGIAANLRRHYSGALGKSLVFLLFAANVLNIGADLGAMAASLHLLVGGPIALYAMLFALICLLGVALCSFRQYSAVLKWLSVSILAYVGAAFVARVPWAEAAQATFMPQIEWSASYVGLLVAVLGTTISPYLFFWQASLEAEEVYENKGEKALIRSPKEVEPQLRRIRVDTYVGMFASNLVAWFIILTTAATLYASGKRDIESAQAAAEALRPLAGNMAFLLFAGGIIGTGLLAVPVLAGSAAFAVGETMRWRVGIQNSPRRAPLFYVILGSATLIGAGLNLTNINPIRALVWSATINGIVAVPVMVFMMLMIHNKKVMGDLAGRGRTLYVMGWIATIVMMVAVCAMIVTWLV